MANNLNTTRIIQETWPRALAQYEPKWTKIARSLSGEPGTVQIGRAEVGGIALTLADNATSATTSDMASFESTFATVHKYVKHVVASHKLRKETAFGDAIMQLGLKTQANIEKDFFDMLAALKDAAHPRVGTGVGQVGASMKYIDAGLKGLQGESGEFTYDNQIATDFGETGLDSAFQLMRGWRDDRGLPMNLGMTGDLMLVVHPSNLKLAHEITKSMLSGADMASNFYNGLVRGVIDYAFADTDSWYLVAADSTPLGYYQAGAPEVTISESDDKLFTIFTAKYTGCPIYSPYEYGLIGSLGND